MEAAQLDNFARALAVCAVTGDRADLEKQAAGVLESLQPYLADPRIRNTLLGLGAGGLIGAVQPRRKLRNALTYGLIGALGGLGLTHLTSGAAGPRAAAGAAGGAGKKPPGAPPTSEELSAALDKSYDPNSLRTLGKFFGGAPAGALGYRAGVGLMKGREGLQNLMDLPTNAQNAPRRPITPTADAAAASAAARQVRDTLSTPAGRQQFAQDAQRSTGAGLAGASDPVVDLMTGNKRRLAVQQLGRDAVRATQPTGYQMRGPSSDAIVGASRVLNPGTTVTPKTMRSALSEANRVAPTRWRHRAGGGALGLASGVLGQWLGGMAGEHYANNHLNNPILSRPASAGSPAPASGIEGFTPYN